MAMVTQASASFSFSGCYVLLGRSIIITTTIIIITTTTTDCFIVVAAAILIIIIVRDAAKFQFNKHLHHCQQTFFSNIHLRRSLVYVCLKQVL